MRLRCVLFWVLRSVVVGLLGCNAIVGNEDITYEVPAELPPDHEGHEGEVDADRDADAGDTDASSAASDGKARDGSETDAFGTDGGSSGNDSGTIADF